MKHLLLAIYASIAFSISAFAQTVLPIKDGQVFYEVVDSSVKATKSDLFVRGKNWVAKNFNNANHVIKQDDKEQGSLIVKGGASLPRIETPSLPMMEDIEFTLEMAFKDNKYRIRVYDLVGSPFILKELQTSAGSMYARYMNNAYESSDKKNRAKSIADSKETDRLVIANLDAYVTKMIASIKKELQKDDSF